MKSEHRHELKTNELAQWLNNLPQWTKKNKTTIIYITALIIVVAGLYYYQYYKKNVEADQQQITFTRLLSQIPQSKMQILQSQQQGQDLAYLLLSPANELKNLADNTKNNQIAAFSLIKQAEILRIELYYRLESPTTEETIAQINKAKKAYIQAYNKTDISPSLIAKAKLGEALCEEELNNFDAAKNIYQQLIEDPALKNTTAAEIAKQRLTTMTDYQKKIVFNAAPKPIETTLPPETSEVTTLTEPNK